MKKLNQNGFASSYMLIGIVLISLVAGVAATLIKTQEKGIDVEKQKADSIVVMKRTADAIEAHRVAVAMGDVKLGQGFAAAMTADMNSWPKDIFLNKTPGTAVTEGTVTYMTGIDPTFCKTLNSVLQVSGVPTPEQAPNDRVVCVITPTTS